MVLQEPGKVCQFNWIGFNMAEVKLGTLYRVEIVEYDSGCQRVDPRDTKIFTTLQEAEAYKATWEQGGHRDCYWRGEITCL